ncbi:MAG: PfkB family carbohydrate kinase [Victivallales bacterium]
MEIKKSRPIDAVVAGYLGVDIAPGFSKRESVTFAELFRPGKLIETKGLHFSLGGVVANTGLAMRKFGQNVSLTGCVGNDALGDMALAQFAQAGVTRGIHHASSAGTAYGIVVAPPGIDRFFLEDPGCNRIFTADDIDYELVGQSRLFHFGYPPLMEALWSNGGLKLKELLERAHGHGAVVSLDMTLPDPDAPAGKADWRAILSAVLPSVDIFVPSIEELLFMLEPQLYSHIAERAAGGDIIDAIPAEQYVRIADKVLAMGVKVLLVKAGHKGAYLRTGDLAELNSSTLRLSDRIGCPHGAWIPPLPVEAARFCNASGAGDCAVAGFLTALLKDENIMTAGQYAMMAGRDNLYGQDALSGLMEWSHMSKSLRTYVSRK